MEEVACAFPFRKIMYYKYLTLDIMMHVERSQALKFMFCANKQGRSFLKKHFISIQNGFINEGLIIHHIYDAY